MAVNLSMPNLRQHILELIRRTSTDLPAAVEHRLIAARDDEEEGSVARGVLDAILENVAIARDTATPLCQDTGTPTFYVRHPVALSTRELKTTICAAVAEAVQNNHLRPNAVSDIVKVEEKNNLGCGHFPVIHFHQIPGKTLHIHLLLKGGGCENVGRQYSLPDFRLNAGRDLDGVRKAALDAVFQAQGRGCAPGFLGIAVGGDRATSYLASKRIFLEDLDSTHPDPEIADLEQRITIQVNQLGIGPMGLGGRRTILTTRIVGLHRHPASFFVTVSYMCWAFRKSTLTINKGKAVYS